VEFVPHEVIVPLQHDEILYKAVCPVSNDVPPVELEHTFEPGVYQWQALLKFRQLTAQVELHLPRVPNVQSGWQLGHCPHSCGQLEQVSWLVSQ
jgi:hypothetical protein